MNFRRLVFFPLSFLLLLATSIKSYSQKNANENSLEFIVKGIEFHDDEKYQAAVKEFNKVNRNDTNYALATYEKSLSLLNAEDYEECIEVCKEGLSLEPTENEAMFYVTYGTALSNSDKYTESIDVYNNGLELYPKNATLRYNLAVVLLKDKQYELGLNTLYQNLRNNPFHGRSHLLLAEIARQKQYPTKAFLAFAFYLTMEDNYNVGFEILKYIDTYANSKMDEGGDYEDFDLRNNGFEDLDELVFNKVAINKKYKTPSRFSYPLIKQMHLISSSLDLISADKEDDFWVEYYIPYFKSMMDNELYEGFSSYIVRSGESANPEIAKNLKRSSSAQNQFIAWFKDNFAEQFGKIELDGKTYDRHFYSGNLVAIGNFENGKKNGDWTYYSDKGSISAEGAFSDDKKEGEWNYYHTGERLESTYPYTDGEVNGNFKEYNKKGILIKEGVYKDDYYNGLVKEYYETGAISSSKEFSKGLMDGEIIFYYRNGKKSLETMCKEGKIEGLFIRYNAVGNKTQELEYENDELNGYAKTWYSNGQLKHSRMYKNDLPEGEWKSYYQNGNIMEEEIYSEGQLIGENTEYYENGKISEKGEFDENGKENGVFKEYYSTGELYAEISYKSGDLYDYKFYDKSGSIVQEGNKKGKYVDYVRIDTNGYKSLEGKFYKGKRDGIWTFFGPRGVIYSELEYKDGEKDGDQTTYYSNGQISEKYQRKAGEIEGLYKSFLKANTDVIDYEGVYKNGEKSGTFVSRNVLGNIISETFYAEGQLDGWLTYYNQKGKISQESYTLNDNFYGLIEYDTNGSAKKYWLENGNGEVRFTYPNGKTSFVGNYINGISEGEYQWFRPDGSVDTKGQYVNDLKHGEWMYYHPNGKVAMIKNYFLGQLEGEYKSFHENGNKNVVSHYRNGRLEGEYTRYFYNGKMREKSRYKYGDLDGERFNYVPSGELAIVRTYSEGVILSYRYMKDNNTFTEDITIESGIQNITAYFASGNKSVEFSIDGNSLTAPFIWYYPNGKMFRYTDYDNDITNGIMKAYYPNGNLQYEYPHKNDNYHGICKDYYENGQLKQSLSYYNDELEGWSSYYDKSGNLTHQYYYFDNQIFSNK